jgi:hypothetical protein
MIKEKTKDPIIAIATLSGAARCRGWYDGPSQLQTDIGYELGLGRAATRSECLDYALEPMRARISAYLKRKRRS